MRQHAARHHQLHGLEDDRAIVLRVGINVGDVAVESDDLLGDGVNVAARLESIAEPGTIYISGSVYDQVKGKLKLDYLHRPNSSRRLPM